MNRWVLEQLIDGELYKWGLDAILLGKKKLKTDDIVTNIAAVVVEYIQQCKEEK